MTALPSKLTSLSPVTPLLNPESALNIPKRDLISFRVHFPSTHNSPNNDMGE